MKITVAGEKKEYDDGLTVISLLNLKMLRHLSM